MDRYVANYNFYQKSLSGVFFSGDPSTYEVKGASLDEVKGYFERVLWQAVEIEGFGNEQILCSLEIEKNGEYVNSETAVLKLKVVRTSEPSKWVKRSSDQLPIMRYSVDILKSFYEIE